RGHSDPHGAARARAHRLRSTSRRLAHARRPRARRAPPRRRTVPASAHWRPRLLSDLPDRRRPLPDGSRARAEVLQPALRAARPPGAGRGPVRADQEPLADELAELFAAKPLATWLELFDGEDVSVGPVATLEEAAAQLGRNPSAAGSA